MKKVKMGTMSLRCPKCGSPTRVTRTSRNTGKNLTIRERKCRRGHRIKSEEKPL